MLYILEYDLNMVFVPKNNFRSIVFPINHRLEASIVDDIEDGLRTKFLPSQLILSELPLASDKISADPTRFVQTYTYFGHFQLH